MNGFIYTRITTGGQGIFFLFLLFRRTAQFTYMGSLPPAGDYRVSTKWMVRDDNNIGDYDFDFTNDFFPPQKDQHGDGILDAFICTQKVTVTEGKADLGDVKLVPAGALPEIPVKNSTGSPVVVDSLYMDTAQSLLYTKVWHPDGSFSDRDMKKGYSMTIKDPNNTIADGETYRVYLSVMPQTISSDVTFKVITKDEKKEYSFAKPGKTLEAGLRYTVTGIELVAPD